MYILGMGILSNFHIQVLTRNIYRVLSYSQKTKQNKTNKSNMKIGSKINTQWKMHVGVMVNLPFCTTQIHK